MSPLDNLETFKVNGWNPLAATDSSIYLEQAHAVLTTASTTLEQGEDLNTGIVSGALRAALTLLSLGILAADNAEEQQRRQKREGR